MMAENHEECANVEAKFHVCANTLIGIVSLERCSDHACILRHSVRVPIPHTPITFETTYAASFISRARFDSLPVAERLVACSPPSYWLVCTFQDTCPLTARAARPLKTRFDESTSPAVTSIQSAHLTSVDLDHLTDIPNANMLSVYIHIGYRHMFAYS